MIDGKAPHEGTNHFASDKEWQDIDYWYNRVVDAKNPASNTANPSALALITFGLTTALLQGANTHWTGMSTQYATVGFMVFFGGMIQTLAGLTEFIRNNMFAGTALASYGAFWIGYGWYLVIVAGGIIPEGGPKGLEFVFCLFNTGYFICAFSLNIALMNLFFSLATYNFLAAGAETGNIVCMKVDPVAFDAPITYMCTSKLVQNQLLHTRPNC
ncbi:TPA: hypothetical protein ACH3X3_001420 [Trebouxia sp. C0006]